MKVPRRRLWVGVLLAAVVVAAMAAVLMIPSRRIRTDSMSGASLRVRAITLALILYAQNIHDEFPPPDRAMALLAASGSIGPAI